MTKAFQKSVDKNHQRLRGIWIKRLTARAAGTWWKLFIDKMEYYQLLSTDYDGERISENSDVPVAQEWWCLRL